jgi:hypothetical protein
LPAALLARCAARPVRCSPRCCSAGALLGPRRGVRRSGALRVGPAAARVAGREDGVGTEPGAARPAPAQRASAAGRAQHAAPGRRLCPAPGRLHRLERTEEDRVNLSRQSKTGSGGCSSRHQAGRCAPGAHTADAPKRAKPTHQPTKQTHQNRVTNRNPGLTYRDTRSALGRSAGTGWPAPRSRRHGYHRSGYRQRQRRRRTPR